jgi:hypothetical protein
MWADFLLEFGGLVGRAFQPDGGAVAGSVRLGSLAYADIINQVPRHARANPAIRAFAKKITNIS